ncbi:NADP-dependent oxidoreductase [Aquisalimonas sp.]|uniref:NADP-dependent oxidoreductase n=1 Tax=Aquisalimonas sp. TaxID=1872621 RepID=UPI0025BBA7C5|nr:NADP-dependent oxidoreductase [Aquisalimonas sp.]
MANNQRIILAARPEGMPDESHLKLESAPMPEPADGEVLLRTIYLSLDPYMRGRMSASKSYAQSVEVGSVMEGGTVCEVEESHHPDWQQGELVLAHTGWQAYAAVNPKGLKRLNPDEAPISTAVGVLGMPGFTAYAGLLEHGRPQKGETVAVSAASGAVGQVVGQLSRLWGCRAVGIAGGPEKCRFVTDELGFDACVDHRSASFEQDLAAACPDGIDVYWENVGGKVQAAAMPLLNEFARIPVCGIIAHYNEADAPAGADRLPGFMRHILTKRLTIRGFIQFDHADRRKEFFKNVAPLVRDGKLKHREDIVQGLENAVSAFQGLLSGKNFGKLLVQVSEDPSRP